MSNQAGQSNLRRRLAEMGLSVEKGDPALSRILDRVKLNEDNGFDVHNIRANLTPSGGFLDGFSLRVSVENLFDSFYQPARALRAAPGRNFKFTVAKRF